MRPRPNPNQSYARRVGAFIRPEGGGQTSPPEALPRLTTLAPAPGAGPGLTLSTATVDLSTARVAGSPLILPIRGNLLIVNASAFASDTAQLRLDGQGSFVTVAAGWQCYGVPFESVEIINAAQAGSSLELVYATDPDGRVWFRYR